MSKQRFFLEDIGSSPAEIIFPENISHQIQNVMRYKEGDQVIVLDGSGNSYDVQLTSLDSKKTIGKVVGEEKNDAKQDVILHLFFPLSRKEKVEWILQRGTEVGVCTFHPYICERSLVQELDIRAGKQNRRENIIREAAEQSQRIFLPQLMSPLAFEEVVVQASVGLDGLLVAWVGENEQSLKQALNDLSLKLNKADKMPEIGLFIGPEGGFTEGEIVDLKNNKALTVSLGKNILRLETAAIVFSALVIHEMAALNS